MARQNVICNHVSKRYFSSVAEHLFRVPCKHCPATPRKGFSVPSPLASVPQRPLLPRGPVPHTLTCHSHSPNPFQQVLSVCTACSSWKTKAQFSLQTKRHGTHGSPSLSPQLSGRFHPLSRIQAFRKPNLSPNIFLPFFLSSHCNHSLCHHTCNADVTHLLSHPLETLRSQLCTLDSFSEAAFTLISSLPLPWPWNRLGFVTTSPRPLQCTFWPRTISLLF